MSRNSGALRKGLAAVLSILSCGGIAVAAKNQNLRKFGGGVTQTVGKKKQVKKRQAREGANGQKLQKNQKRVDAVSQKVLADVATPKTFSGEMCKAAEHVKNSWSALTSGKQALAGVVGLETLSVLYNGCGVVENVLGTILGPSLQQLGALIFRSEVNDSAGQVQNIYRRQYQLERGVENQQGLVLGLIGKIAFYLKDNYVDFIRAFYHGCNGDSLDVKVAGVTDPRLFKHDGVFDFYNYKNVGNWGPNQLELFLESMKMNWKRSPLNVWAYRFGRLFASKPKGEFFEEKLSSDEILLDNGKLKDDNLN